MRSAPSNRGFSYVELLVSTGIIGICYYLYLGPGSQGYETRARAKCAANLQQLHLSLTLYAQEHDAAYPVFPGAATADQPLNELVPQYTAQTSLFTCPAGTAGSLPEAEPILGRRISYAYYMGVKSDPATDAATPLVTDTQVTTLPKLVGDRVFVEKHSALGGNHRQFGGNVLFADGHVETIGNVAAQSLVPRDGVTLLNPKP